MGGIQSFSALPGDPTFNQINSEYDVASYKRICNEFGISPSSDFRFKKGNNRGLGNVYIYISNHGLRETHMKYPGGFYKFSDEGGMAKDGNLANLIKNDMSYNQYDYFMRNHSNGLTTAGLSRLNQRIEAFVYCVLGAQVNTRPGIRDQRVSGTKGLQRRLRVNF